MGVVDDLVRAREAYDRRDGIPVKVGGALGSGTAVAGGPAEAPQPGS